MIFWSRFLKKDILPWSLLNQGLFIRLRDSAFVCLGLGWSREEIKPDLSRIAQCSDWTIIWKGVFSKYSHLHEIFYRPQIVRIIIELAISFIRPMSEDSWKIILKNCCVIEKYCIENYCYILMKNIVKLNFFSHQKFTISWGRPLIASHLCVWVYLSTKWLMNCIHLLSGR